ncbi:hypothetical protein BDF21DRAFT_422094 [Thamnidium elegans]|nr:hypothetical protein BDF21DRAFT_422094 [Thamnidium elegans]
MKYEKKKKLHILHFTTTKKLHILFYSTHTKKNNSLPCIFLIPPPIQLLYISPFYHQKRKKNNKSVPPYFLTPKVYI